MHAMAVRDGADVVLGKVVGHGKPVPPTLFAEEGPRRLEDHVFVLGALFRTRRVSVLADYPCYHWMLRDRETNASANEFDPAIYYRNLQEVLDVVDEHTEPGELRDRLYARWYRGKVLSRVGGLLFFNRAPDARRARFAEIRSLTEQRFRPELDAQLPFSLRLRSQLVRAGTVEQLERLAELETRLEPRVTVAACRVSGDAAELRLEATVRDPGGLLLFDATDDGATWRPPESLADGVPRESLDAAGAFDANDAHVLLREAEDPEEFLVPATVRTRLVPDTSAPGRVRLALDIDARVAAGSVAAGRRLRRGRYVLRTVMHVAGFRLSAPVTRGARGMLLMLAVDDRGRVKPARPTWKQRLAAWAPGIRRLALRAKQALRRSAG
jgi:hypothetical protein